MIGRYALRLVLPASLLLGACASRPPAPVVDLSHWPAPAASAAPAPAPVPPTVAIVHKGDSLYVIALRENLDWRDIAYWNGIAPPYIVQPGERLRLTPAPGAVPRPAASASEPRMTTQPLVTTSVQMAPPPQPAQPKSPPPSTPQKSPPQHLPAATAAAAVAPTQPAVPALASRTVGSIAWSWPTQGDIIQTFAAGDPTRQGIGIAGHRGAPVRAAADGVVVYSGNGLVGYGELVVVKHSDTFLSVYGHNDKRLVKEGEHVRAGQEIAEMGSSGTSRVELHFEIRKNGKPVDPLAFLPAHP